MNTWDELMKADKVDGYLNYRGSTEHKDMLVLLAKSRDSDTISRSNFDCALDMLGENLKPYRFILLDIGLVGGLN